MLRDFALRHLDTVDGCLMQKELLDSQLLRDGAVGVALPALTFHGSLDARHLHVALEDRLVAHHPDDLVDDVVLSTHGHEPTEAERQQERATVLYGM